LSRIDETFQALRERHEAALVAYVTAGDPDLKQSRKVVQALANAGADIIELGIPFSDPIADGPTIQGAMIRALAAKATPWEVLELCEDVSDEVQVPLVLLTYFNPLFKLGLEGFVRKARNAGVDGFIVADLPIEEAADYIKVARSNAVDTIFLASPATPDERAKRIISETRGFLYLVSLYGVTGARKELGSYTTELTERFAALAEGKIPVCVGFGISRPEHVRAVLASKADGVIVGSAIVKEIERHRSNRNEMLRRIRILTAQLKGATKGPR